MSFRSKLNDYIQKNELPDWLEAGKLTELLPSRGDAVTQGKRVTPSPVIKTPATVKPTPAAPSADVQKPAQPKDTVKETAVPKVLDAKTFIEIARSEKLTGGEFLELLGNSRLSNSAYKEIELNPEITLERIIEILEASPLVRDDYVKLIAAINTIVKNRKKAEHRSERGSMSAFGDTTQLPTIEPRHMLLSDTVSVDLMNEIRQPEPTINKSPVRGEIPEEKPLDTPAPRQPEKPAISESRQEIPQSKPENPTAKAPVLITPDGSAYERISFSSPEKKTDEPVSKPADLTKPTSAAIISDFASLVDEDKPPETKRVTAQADESSRKVPAEREFSVADIAADRTAAIIMPDFTEDFDFSDNADTARPSDDFGLFDFSEQNSDVGNNEKPDTGALKENDDTAAKTDFSSDFDISDTENTVKQSADDLDIFSLSYEHTDIRSDKAESDIQPDKTAKSDYNEIKGASAQPNNTPEQPHKEERIGYAISGIAVKPPVNEIKPAHTVKSVPDGENGFYIPSLAAAVSATDEKKPEPQRHAPKSALQKSLDAIISEKKPREINATYGATNEPDEISHLSDKAADDMAFSSDLFSLDDEQGETEHTAAEPLIAPDDDFFSEKLAPKNPLSVTTILSDLSDSADSKAHSGKPVDTSVTTILSGLTDISEKTEPEKSEKKSETDAPKKKAKNIIDLPEPSPDEQSEHNSYKGSEYFEDVKPVKKGKGKLIAVIIIIIVLLIGGAMGASYLLTGSFIPFLNSGEQEETVPETITVDSYTQLAELISAQPPAARPAEYTQFNTESAPYNALLGNIASVGDRIYYADKNTVTQLTAADGKPEYVSENTYECSAFLGIAALNSQLCVVYEKDGATVAALYGSDLSKPQYTYAQDGSFTGITYINERLCLTTEYTAPEGATAENAAPTYSVNDTKTSVECANIYIRSAPESRSFTVISSVSENPLVFAVAGASSSFAEIDGNGICVVANYAKNATVRKFDINEHTVSVSAETTVLGAIPAPSFIDERGGKIRILTATDEGAVLGVYSSALELTAQADKIAAGEEITGVSFNDSLVSVITAGIMRCFNTDGDTIKTLDTAVCTPYTQNLLRFGDSLTGVEVITDDNGVRNGLRVAMYSYENKLSAVSEKVISIVGTDGTNYNEYLNSDVETNPAALTVSEELKTIVVPIVYFDGVSEVEKFITYKYNVSDGFMQAGEFTLYDENSKFRASIICGGYIYVAVDDTVTGISLDSGKVIATAKMEK